MQSIIKQHIQEQPKGEQDEAYKSATHLKVKQQKVKNHELFNLEQKGDGENQDLEKESDYLDITLRNQQNNDNNMDDSRNFDDIIGIIDESQKQKEKKIDQIQTPKQQSKGTQFIKRLKTSVAIQNDYFSEDTRDLEGKCQQDDNLIEPEEFYKVDEYKIDFSYGRFIYVLMIHIFYYIILGPFSVLFMAYKPGLILMKNFFFYPRFQVVYITQSLIWIFNMANIVFYFIFDTSNIYFVEILYMNILIFLRCAVIAAKYASLHPLRWKLYNKRILQPEFTQYDFYLQDWVKQNYKTIYTETYHALRRGEYDYSIFYLDFFVNPKKETIDITQKHIQECHKYHKNINDIFQPPCMFQDLIDKNYVSIYGYGVVAEIVQNFMKNDGFQKYSKYVMMLGFLRGFLTLIYRLIVNDSLDLSAVEVFQLVGIILNTSMNCVSLYGFLFFYIRDLKLKHYCQEQCTILLDLKRQYKVEHSKLFPTIDITNQYALKSWSILRRVLFDYGKSFDIRMQAYFQLNMFVFIIMVVIFILWFFGVYKFPLEYVVVSIYEMLVYFVLLSLILLRGALINQQFQINLNIVADLKVMAIDLLRLRKSYFIDKKVPANMIIRRAVQKILDELEQNSQFCEELVTKKIQQIQDSMEDCEKELKVDELNRPFKFFYIKVTLALVQTIGAGFLTLVGAMVQYKLLN